MAIKIGYAAPKPRATVTKGPRRESWPEDEPPPHPDSVMTATIWFREEDAKIMSGIEWWRPYDPEFWRDPDDDDFG